MTYSGPTHKVVEHLHGKATRLANLVDKHQSTIGAVVEHGAYQAEGMAAGGLAALVDHYLGSNGAPATLVGIPVVGLAGLAAGGLALLGGARPWAGHVAVVGATWEGIGVYNLVGTALAGMSK